MSSQPIRSLLSVIAGILTIVILADQLLDGRIRRALEAWLDHRPRDRREGFTPGAELVIARAEEITEEAARDEH